MQSLLKSSAQTFAVLYQLNIQKRPLEEQTKAEGRVSKRNPKLTELSWFTVSVTAEADRKEL